MRSFVTTPSLFLPYYCLLLNGLDAVVCVNFLKMTSYWTINGKELTDKKATYQLLSDCLELQWNRATVFFPHSPPPILKSNQALRQFPEMALLANGKVYYRMQREPINGNKAEILSCEPP